MEAGNKALKKSGLSSFFTSKVRQSRNLFLVWLAGCLPACLPVCLAPDDRPPRARDYSAGVGFPALRRRTNTRRPSSST